MREHVRGLDFAPVIGATLHAVATGNILSARTRLVLVDINPAALTKLRDQGRF